MVSTLPVLRPFLRFALAVSVLVILSALVHAQIMSVDDTTSTPVPGTGHDYIHALSETVNPANGSVSLRIQLPTAPSRGITLPISIAYDSNSVYANVPGWNQYGAFVTTYPNVGYLQQGGWSYSLPMASYGYSTYQAGTYPNFYNCSMYTGYVFGDSTGGRHALELGTQYSADVGGCPQSGLSVGTGGDPQVIATLPTTHPDPYYNPQAMGGGPPTGVFTDDGTVYKFGTSGHGTSNSSVSYYLPSTIEDRNGNIVTIHDVASQNNINVSFSVTDTAGRNAISATGFGPSGSTNTITVAGSTYQITWKTTSASYSAPSTPLTNTPVYCGAVGGATFSETVISAITLPNGTQYRFYYGNDNPNSTFNNPYGLLSEIDYPDGGSVKYLWKLSDTLNQVLGYPSPSCLGACSGEAVDPVTDGCIFEYETPVVATRYVSFGGSQTVLTQTFKYSTSWNWSGSNGTTPGLQWTSKTTTVNALDVTGQSAVTTYTYSPILAPGGGPFDFSYHGQLPQEQSTKYCNWGSTSCSTTNAIRQINKTWFDLFNVKSEQTVLDNGLSSMINHTYTTVGTTVGGFSEPQEKDEYDFGASSPMRMTNTSYQSFSGTPGIIANRACSVVVCSSGSSCSSGTSNKVSETDYLYDGGATVCSALTAAQTKTSGVSGLATGTHDETLFPPSLTPPTLRGNVTQKIRWLSTGAPTTSYTYDETGQRLSMVDPCGNVACGDVTGSKHTTTYSYTDAYTVLSGSTNTKYTPTGKTNTYVTKITDPLGHTNSFVYDYNNGQLTSATDPNSQPTTYVYADPFSRPTLVNYPDGGTVTYSYSDVAPSPSVTTSKTISSALTEVSTTTFDGIDHVVQTQLTSDPAGTVFTNKTYDGSGRTLTVTNPYRATSDPTYGSTTYSYDALGRNIQLKHPDGTILTTSYTGRATSVTDEGNGVSRVARVSQTDGLGRLLSVCEITSATQFGGGSPAACGQDIGATGFITNYTYDVLDNLQTVQQGSRSRYFSYDSFSRLQSATNPESGTTSYTYDSNSNVSTRIRPAPNQTNPATTLTTTYKYDVLNRLTSTTYSDSVTLPVSRRYDTTLELGRGLNNTIGRLSAEYVTTSSGKLVSGKLFGYDPMGRVNDNSQCTPSGCASSTAAAITYAYDLLGDMQNVTNGEGTTFSYVYDSAGRLTTVTSNLSDANHPASLFSNGTYNPLGSLTGASLGSALNEAFAYDCRGRVLAYASVVYPIVPSLSVTNTTGCSITTSSYRGIGRGSDFQFQPPGVFARDVVPDPRGTPPSEFTPARLMNPFSALTEATR